MIQFVFPQGEKKAMTLFFHFDKNLTEVGKMTAWTSEELFPTSSILGRLS